jgi:hypothetical protein
VGLFVGMAGGQHHALGHAELHLARRQVGHHHGELADQLLGRVGAAMPLKNTLRGACLRPRPASGAAAWSDALHRLARATIRAMRRSTLAKSSMPIVSRRCPRRPGYSVRAASPLSRRLGLEQGLKLFGVDPRHQVLVGADAVAVPQRARGVGQGAAAPRRGRPRPARPARGSTGLR